MYGRPHRGQWPCAATATTPCVSCHCPCPATPQNPWVPTTTHTRTRGYATARPRTHQTMRVWPRRRHRRHQLLRVMADNPAPAIKPPANTRPRIRTRPRTHTNGVNTTTIQMDAARERLLQTVTSRHATHQYSMLRMCAARGSMPSAGLLHRRQFARQGPARACMHVCDDTGRLLPACVSAPSFRRRDVDGVRKRRRHVRVQGQRGLRPPIRQRHVPHGRMPRRPIFALRAPLGTWCLSHYPFFLSHLCCRRPMHPVLARWARVVVRRGMWRCRQTGRGHVGDTPADADGIPRPWRRADWDAEQNC